jgi:exodeoxyribonuclease VII large subunit
MQATVGVRAWSVGALVLAVADALAARFSSVVVAGELSGFTRAVSGHCYFTLKDADGAAASMRCALFRRAASLLDFAPRDGQHVELRGRIAVYEPRGELQFVAESMRALGAGSLYEQFLRLKARLEAQGLFDAARKRALPRLPACVGVVTSSAGAALHDVLTTLARRAPHVRVVVYPSPVQGADAPAALVAALGTAAARGEADVLILARGGGSLEDLWAFNDEQVVRAVAALPMPVVTGVGHETDVTLVDFAADLRAATPTAAAELVAPLRDELDAALVAAATRLRRRVGRHLDAQAQRLDHLALHLVRPQQAVAGARHALQALEHRHARALARGLDGWCASVPRRHERLRAAVRARLLAERARTAQLGARLAALDPSRVLARGYALVLDIDGGLIPAASAVAPGQSLALRFHDGRVGARADADPA